MRRRDVDMARQRISWIFLIAAALLVVPAMAATAAGITLQEVSNTTEGRYGSHMDAGGWVHFVVYSPDAAALNLLLFEKPGDKTPAHTVPMQKDGADWKIKAKGEGIGPGLAYMYQAKGTNEISKDDQYGLMFNENFFLNDPYCEKT